MNILLCTSETGMMAGGLALHAAQLKEIFEELGHKVYVEILLNPKDIYVIDGGYDSELGKRIRASYKIREMVIKYNNCIDLCVSCGAGMTAYYSMIFCKEENIPLYIVLCGSEVNLSYGMVDLAFYNTEAFKYASVIVGLSKELIQNAKIIGDNRRCKYYVIPNICEIEKIPVQKKDNRNYIVYGSGAYFLGEKKGIANLIIAFSKLINDLGRNDILYLFGKIDDDIRIQYEKLIAENFLNKNVIICGDMDRGQFRSKLKEIDIYIQASPFEGFGNSVAEAIMSGKDILISNTGYIAELISKEYSEHILKSLDPNIMAKSLQDFAENIYPKRENEEIRKKLESELNRKTIISKWNNILNEQIKPVQIMNTSICMAVAFHDINCSYTGVDYALSGFEELINKINRSGYVFCSVREYLKKKEKKNTIICTFDDGYENVFKNAFPIMKRYGFTATVYVCPDLIGKDNSWNHKDDMNRKHMTHEMLVELADAGWEIGSHGLMHINMLRLSECALEHNLKESKKQLEIYGLIDSFCYPYGAFNAFIKEKVEKYYANAFSVSIGGCDYINDLYQLTRMTPEELIERLGL